MCQGVPKETAVVMTEDGMPDLEHVKKWAVQGHLMSREADLGGSEHGEREVAAW